MTITVSPAATPPAGTVSTSWLPLSTTDLDATTPTKDGVAADAGLAATAMAKTPSARAAARVILSLRPGSVHRRLDRPQDNGSTTAGKLRLPPTGWSCGVAG